MQKKIRKKYFNKIIKIYNNTEEINITELPNKFALKTNHGSGFNIIVKNKTNFNLTYAKEKLNHWLNIDYGALGEELNILLLKEKFLLKNI